MFHTQNKFVILSLMTMLLVHFTGCAQLTNLSSLKKSKREYVKLENYPEGIRFWFNSDVEAETLRQAVSIFIVQPALFGIQNEDLLDTRQSGWLSTYMERSIEEQFGAFYKLKSQAIGVELSLRSEMVVYQTYSAAQLQRLPLSRSESSSVSELSGDENGASSDLQEAKEELMAFELVEPFVARFELEFVGAAGRPLFAVEGIRSFPFDIVEQLEGEGSLAIEGALSAEGSLPAEGSQLAEGSSPAVSLGDLADFCDLVMDAAIRRMAERTL